LVYSETIRFTIIKSVAIKNTITVNYFEIDGNDFIGSTANDTLSKRENNGKHFVDVFDFLSNT
jgi:hypothetical protein